MGGHPTTGLVAVYISAIKSSGESTTATAQEGGDTVDLNGRRTLSDTYRPFTYHATEMVEI